jgi:hypothetical protein
MAKTLFGEYGYTGAPQNINLPSGLYLFELYGAQGKILGILQRVREDWVGDNRYL